MIFRFLTQYLLHLQVPTKSQGHDTGLRKSPPNLLTEYERGKSIQSFAALPSPSLVAARAFHLEQLTPTGQAFDAHGRRKSLFEVQQIPRRHSALVPTRESAIRIATLDFPQDQTLPILKAVDSASPAVNAEYGEREDDSLTDSRKKRISDVKAVSVAKLHERSGKPLEHLFRPIPFNFSHDHLREWGHAYFGTSSLQTPSLIH